MNIETCRFDSTFRKIWSFSLFVLFFFIQFTEHVMKVFILFRFCLVFFFLTHFIRLKKYNGQHATENHHNVYTHRNLGITYTYMIVITNRLIPVWKKKQYIRNGIGEIKDTKCFVCLSYSTLESKKNRFMLAVYITLYCLHSNAGRIWCGVL